MTIIPIQLITRILTGTIMCTIIIVSIVFWYSNENGLRSPVGQIYSGQEKYLHIVLSHGLSLELK